MSVPGSGAAQAGGYLPIVAIPGAVADPSGQGARSEAQGSPPSGSQKLSALVGVRHGAIRIRPGR